MRIGFMVLPFAVLAVSGPTIVVPRNTTPVVIDSRVQPNEWSGAAEQTLPDGSRLRLQHDGTYLYVAFTSPRSGFLSMCHAQGDSVRILHASAALGSVRYGRAHAVWSSRDSAFVYGMRNTDTTDVAHQERRTYLAQNGWVASTVRMGQGLTHEMQVALEQLGPSPRIAFGFFVIGAGDSWSIGRWPAGMSEQEGCIDAQLVRGYVPQGLRFDPSTWAELRL